MMRSQFCWDDIKTPKQDITVRKIAGTSHIPVYIGKNIHGQYLILFQLVGEHLHTFTKSRVTVFGLNIDLSQVPNSGFQNLVIMLENAVDKDIFTALCQSLIATIANVDEPAIALAVLLAHLKRWKAFLAGKNAQKLTPEEIRGLFAELYYLETLLSEAEVNEHHAIMMAWVGTERSHQDFIFSNTAIECKALSGKERGVVGISSEDQLEGLVAHLYLKLFRLGERPDVEFSISLNEQVTRLERLLIEAETLTLLTNKLIAAGYLPLDDYNTPEFIVLGETTYSVAGDFPRITRAGLPNGILNTRYELELSKIEHFICNNKIDWRL